jgi:LysM repeat protein
MMRRSPARFLAPLALIGFVVALLLVISASNRSDDEQPASRSATVQRKAADRSARKAAARRKPRKPRTYVVQAGDTPSGIAERTGVPLTTIEELNPDLDAQSLRVGDKIRIR